MERIFLYDECNHPARKVTIMAHYIARLLLLAKQVVAYNDGVVRAA